MQTQYSAKIEENISGAYTAKHKYQYTEMQELAKEFSFKQNYYEK